MEVLCLWRKFFFSHINLSCFILMIRPDQKNLKNGRGEMSPNPHSQLVKNLPAILETSVQSLGWEAPLEKGKATHSSTPAWRIPWTVWSMGSQRVRHDWAPFTFTSTTSTGQVQILRLEQQAHFLINSIYTLCNQSMALLLPLILHNAPPNVIFHKKKTHQTEFHLWCHLFCILSALFFFFKYLFLFMYLAALGLHCGMWGLSCGMQTLSCGMWDPIPLPGVEPGPPASGALSLSHWTTREVSFQHP